MMKKLKKSFILLVALATLGITLMSHTSLLKPKEGFEPSHCYKPDITLKYTCNNPDINLTATTSCSYARDYDHGSHIFDINPSDYIQAAEVTAECPGSGGVFCCATVISDQTITDLQPPCAGQPYFTIEGLYNQYEILDVYCKPED